MAYEEGKAAWPVDFEDETILARPDDYQDEGEDQDDEDDEDEEDEEDCDL